jgi:hypothetical protein
MQLNEKYVDIKCYEKCSTLVYLLFGIFIILFIIFYDLKTESTYFPSILL